MELSQSEQGVILTLTRFLQRRYQKVLSADRIKCSVDLLHKFNQHCDKEGMYATALPQIDYKKIFLLQIPSTYSAADAVTTKALQERGLPESWIEALQKGIPEERCMLEQRFEEYCKSPHFELREGETLEQVRDQIVAPFIPFTRIAESAVPKRVAVALDNRAPSPTMLYALAAQMPAPKDAPHVDQLHAYIECCMQGLIEGIKVESDSTLYFNYRMVSQEKGYPIVPKIALYVSVVYATEEERAKEGMEVK